MKSLKEALKAVIASILIAMMILFFLVVLASYTILTFFVPSPALDKQKD